MNFKIRILPIFLVIIFLMLSVRFGDMWVEFTSVTDTASNDGRFSAQDLAAITSGQALAQEAGEAPALDDPALIEDDTLVEESLNETPEGMEPTDVVEQEDYFSGGNFGDMSPGEIRLLHDLVARREALDKRERVVKEREALLRSAEQQLLDKQAQLEDIKSSIEDLLKVYKEEQTEEAKRLVKIYSNMKPKSAARIFNDMDMPTLIQVLRGMKERSIAPIMAAMNADKARLVTRELATVEAVDGAEGALQ
ncbi:MotE family protein [Curvivirga sp.]|uniref:MotE family protein n=1 Tax=Curvivirga sp. TaxID=2856848 RepID=UPI003B596D39